MCERGCGCSVQVILVCEWISNDKLVVTFNINHNSK
jgi:hypothetical protein